MEGAEMPDDFMALCVKTAEKAKDLNAHELLGALRAMAKASADRPDVSEVLYADAAEKVKDLDTEELDGPLWAMAKAGAYMHVSEAPPRRRPRRRRTSTGRTRQGARAVAKTGAHVPDVFEALCCKVVEKSEDFNARPVHSWAWPKQAPA